MYQRRHQQGFNSSSKEEEESQEIEIKRRIHRQPFQVGEWSDYEVKLDQPNFSRKQDIETFLDAIKSVENFFKCANRPNNKKVSSSWRE